MNLSGWHILLLIIVILIFFGPSRLPGLGKSMGEAIRGFKKGMDGDEIDVTPAARRENLDDSKADPLTQSQAQKKRNDV
jgi:sec-independent protein translocase protein TatA